jgi:1-acyl-sn-glycerol-3-phosphate acyltransferase
MAHWGAHEVFPRYAKRFHIFPRKTVRVLVGDPVDLSSFAGRPMDRATLSEATDVIMEAITGLLATLRGEEAPAERWDPAVHKQAKHGRFVERGSTPARGGVPGKAAESAGNEASPGDPESEEGK